VKPRATFTLVSCLLSASLPLHAQGEVLRPGARVRIWPTCAAPSGSVPKGCAPVVGRLLMISATNALVLPDRGSEETLPLDPATRLEVSTGSRHHTLLGLGVGTVVGFGVGMALAGRAGCDRGIFGSGGRDSEDDLCGAYGLVAVPLGAVLGAVVGRLIRSDRWTAVTATTVMSGAVPSPTRVGLGIGFAF
jgi:hypothetical protein